MAICSSHRFCTCDVYKHSDKTNVDWIGIAGSKCSTHSDITENYYTNSIISSDSGYEGGSTICYGYSDDSCIVHKINCHPDTVGYAYNCPGHRSYDDINRKVVINCASGIIIDNEQINTIQNELKNEIDARKHHLMYSSEDQIRYSESNVNGGNLISNFQPNKIKDALEKLRARITELPDYKVAPINTYTEVVKNDPIQSKSLNDLLNDFNSQHVDCICYSDCTAYGLWKYKICTCNINCRCNY